MTRAIFAIPGDMHRKTGGFLYEAAVLKTLNKTGCATAHMQLPDSFPDPTERDMADTLRMLCDVPSHIPIILDGLVYGAIDPDGLARVPAPVIAMIHHPLGLETGLDPARAQFLLDNEAGALRHAAHVMVPSPHTAAILEQDFGVAPDQITIALPGFDRPMRQPITADPSLIISVGLLAPRKGHDVLLKALAQITDLPWQAEIIGKDHEAGYARVLTDLRLQLGLNDRVRFMGELDRPALEARMNAARIFALATRYEGYGMVLSEAMLFDLPIVSCNAGAVPDTVGDAGILVDVDDIDGFANGLRNLLENETTCRAYAQKASQLAKQLPTWEDTATKFASVIAKLSDKD